jgi:hypothetical protein
LRAIQKPLSAALALGVGRVGASKPLNSFFFPFFSRENAAKDEPEIEPFATR